MMRVILLTALTTLVATLTALLINNNWQSVVSIVRQIPEKGLPPTLHTAGYTIVTIATFGFLAYNFWATLNYSFRRWYPPAALSLLSVVDDLRQTDERIKLRIVATEDGKRLAEQIAFIFRYFDWEIQGNPETATDLFPAKNSFRGVRIKCRPFYDDKVYRRIYRIVKDLVLESPITTEVFPNTDAYNFIQIEVGDERRKIMWPQLFKD